MSNKTSFKLGTMAVMKHVAVDWNYSPVACVLAVSSPRPGKHIHDVITLLRVRQDGSYFVDINPSDVYWNGIEKVFELAK